MQFSFNSKNKNYNNKSNIDSQQVSYGSSRAFAFVFFL